MAVSTIPTRTTANSANEHAADHNTLSAAFNAQVWFLPPAALAPFAGSPSLDAVGSKAPGWLLDADTQEAVAVVVEPPADWDSFDVDVLWAPTASSSGDVCLRVEGSVLSDGDVLPAPSTLGTVTASAAGTADTVADTPIVNGHAVTAGKPHVLVIRRVADDATDTYASDIAILGVRLSKAS